MRFSVIGFGDVLRERGLVFLMPNPTKRHIMSCTIIFYIRKLYKGFKIPSVKRVNAVIVPKLSAPMWEISEES